MKFQRIIIIFVALVLALFALIMVKAVTSKNQNEIQKPVIATTQVLTSPQDYKPGDMLSVEKLIWKEWPQQSVNKLYITKNQTADLKSLDGAIVRFPIFSGEPIMMSNVIKTGGKSLLSAIIRPGMRAVSVPYTKLANTPALIAPGDIVDVVIPHKTENGPNTNANNEESYEGRTIIHEVRVLAVDSVLQKMTPEPVAAGSEGFTPRTITLEVSPDQAEELAASIHEGQIVISMRSIFAGQEKAGTEKTAKNRAEPIIPPKEVKKDRVISLFRGSEKTDVTVR